MQRMHPADTSAQALLMVSSLMLSVSKDVDLVHPHKTLPFPPVTPLTPPLIFRVSGLNMMEQGGLQVIRQGLPTR